MNQDSSKPAPVLTLDPAEEIAAPAAALSSEIARAAQAETTGLYSPAEASLTEDEIRQAEAFADKIELRNSSLVVQYGSGAQRKIADFSENALNTVRSKDLGKVGEALARVVTELRGFDSNLNDGGILGFLKRKFTKLAAIKARYDKAEANIDKICEILEGHQVQLLKDVAMFDKMYEMNKIYFKELTMYIIAGKKKLADVRSSDLPALESRGKETGAPEDAQAANDLANVCDRFEKKIHDLELTRAVSLQMAPQIRLVQSGNILMSEKIQSTLVNTVPLWKSQMVLTMGITRSKDAAAAQREVTEMTNELLRTNAETLRQASVETAAESERGIIDMETLRFTNEQLIATLDEVLRIQEDGRLKRHQAETEIAKIETELKEKLLRIKKEK